jgi:serine/threonine protein phosphatase 1
MELLERVKFNPTEDTLISLGDVMDRGAYSYEMFRYFYELKKQMGDQFVYIRGNHEQMFLDSVEDEDMSENWERNGKKETVKSFADHGDDIYRYYQWIKDNTVLYYIGSNYQCVHGGLVDEDPAKNDPMLLVWDRDSLFFNEYSGRLTIVGHTPLIMAAHYDGVQELPHLLRYGVRRKLPKTGMLCIDTACVTHNLLTVMVIEGDEYYLEAAKGPDFDYDNEEDPVPFDTGLIHCKHPENREKKSKNFTLWMLSK